VSDKAERTVRIKWVRSGIGFSYHQKRIVRSLGLKKLNQEVERPDTPQIRGLVAKVPHLVKIVEAASKPDWTLVPEYTIYPPEAVSSKPAEKALEAPAAETEKTEAAATADVTATTDQSEIPRGVTSEQTAEILLPRPRGQDDSARAQHVIEAPAAETATEASGDLAATKVSESADASGAESAPAGEERSPGEGQSKA